MSQRRTPRSAQALQTPTLASTPSSRSNASASQGSGLRYALLAVFAVVLFVGAAVMVQRNNGNAASFQTYGDSSKTNTGATATYTKPVADEEDEDDATYPSSAPSTSIPTSTPSYPSSGSFGSGKKTVTYQGSTGYPVLAFKDLRKLEKKILSRIDDAEKLEFQEGDTVGALVRLGFHDSGHYNTSAKFVGGPHACLAIECTNGQCEFDAPENNGLQEIIRSLKEWYVKDKANALISLADYFQLAANMAIWRSSDWTFKPNFRYGRPDCAKFFDLSKFPFPGRPRFDGGQLPAAVEDVREIKRVFVSANRHNLSPAEAVSLLGAHHLGRTENRFSGFDGKWLENSNKWNNEFFTDVLNHQWFPKTSGRGLPFYKPIFFELPDNYAIMLNTDISIYYDIFANGRNNRCAAMHQEDRSLFSGIDTNRLPICKSHEEANNEFKDYAVATRKFSASNKYWLDTFRSAWQKLTEAGNGVYFTLYDVVVDKDACEGVSCGSSPFPCVDVTGECKNGQCVTKPAEEGRPTHLGRVLGKCYSGEFKPVCHNIDIPGAPATCNPLLCCHQNEGCRHGVCITSFRKKGFNCTEIGFDTILPCENCKCDGLGNCTKTGAYSN